MQPPPARAAAPPSSNDVARTRPRCSAPAPCAPQESIFLLATCYHRASQSYRAYHLLKGLAGAQSRYLFALCCLQLGKLTEAESALMPDNDASRVRAPACGVPARSCPPLSTRARTLAPPRRCPTAPPAFTCWAASTSCPTATVPRSPITTPPWGWTPRCGARTRSCALWGLTRRRSSLWARAARLRAPPARVWPAAAEQQQRQQRARPHQPACCRALPRQLGAGMARAGTAARPPAQCLQPLRGRAPGGWAACLAGWTAGGSTRAQRPCHGCEG